MIVVFMFFNSCFLYIGFVKDFFTKVHDDPFGPLSPHFASECPGQSSLRCSMPNLPVIKTRAKPSLQWNDSRILSKPPKSNFTSCSWHMYSDVVCRFLFTINTVLE
ncbi:hypothetical protein Bca4012_075864 [Brassica carinata]